MALDVLRYSVSKFLENLNFSQSLELNRLQNINRYILEQIEMGYLVLDENCHVVLSNPAACHLLGIHPKYAHATKQSIVYKCSPIYLNLFKFDQLQDGEKFQFESQLSHLPCAYSGAKTRSASSNADFIGADKMHINSISKSSNSN